MQDHDLVGSKQNRSTITAAHVCVVKAGLGKLHFRFQREKHVKDKFNLLADYKE